MPIPLGILAVAGAGAGGGGGPAFDLLETTLISTNTASVTFSSLGSYSDYKHLQIRAVAKVSNVSDDLINAFVSFNGDESGGDYAFHNLNGTGSTVASQASVSQNYIRLTNVLINNGSGVSNQFGAFVLDLLDFNSTSKNKTIRSLGGAFTTAEKRVELTSGFYNSTNAISSIKVSPSSGNFVSGSRFSLYGVK